MEYVWDGAISLVVTRLELNTYIPKAIATRIRKQADELDKSTSDMSANIIARGDGPSTHPYPMDNISLNLEDLAEEFLKDKMEEIASNELGQPSQTCYTLVGCYETLDSGDYCILINVPSLKKTE